MIPPHVLFADPNRFDLEILSKLYRTNKEWVSYCDTVKESVIQKSFEPYQLLHGVSITSSNTLFQLIPLKNYLQQILDLQEEKANAFPKKIPNIFLSKCHSMTMKQVYPTLVVLLKLQLFIAKELLYIPEEEVYPYQLLNVILIYQALEKICIEYRFKELLEHKTFLRATIDKCSVLLEETKHKSKKMTRDTKYIYYHCVRYIRRVKRMLQALR